MSTGHLHLAGFLQWNLRGDVTLVKALIEQSRYTFAGKGDFHQAQTSLHALVRIRLKLDFMNDIINKISINRGDKRVELKDILQAVLHDHVKDMRSLRNYFTSSPLFKNPYLRQIDKYDSSTISTVRFSKILDNCFGNNISDKGYKQLLIFKDKTIVPGNMMELHSETIRRRWDRYLKDGSIPQTSSCRLELAVLLTSILAANLATYKKERLNDFVELYMTCFDILKIGYRDNLIKRLIPSNEEKARDDWSKAILGHEYQSTVLTFDLLCLTVYLALSELRYGKKNEKDFRTITSVWKEYLYTNSIETDYEQTSLNVDKIINEVYNRRHQTVGTSNGKRISQPGDTQEQNDLFGDPRFSRQSNLYYHIDMQAIHEVVNNLTRKDLVVLDLGCGDGEVTCSRFGGIAAVSKVIGIDVVQKQVNIARARAERDVHKNKFKFYQLDLQRRDLMYQLRKILNENGVEKVDIIFSAMTFHHLSDPESLLAHVRTVLSDDGYLILRELDDDTKIYYAQGDVESVWMDKVISAYQKVFQYTDRYCARKMHSWLALQGFQNIKMFYDPIDTCGKNAQEKADIFYIMVGFRKAKAENRLKLTNLDEETVAHLHEVVNASNELQRLFKEDDLWFFCMNYIAVARNKRIDQHIKVKHPPVELYIIRHGHCDITQTGSGISITISEKGKKEIAKLSERLSDTVFDEIVCSTMERSYETARPIALSHGLELRRYPELNEINRGDILTDKMWENSSHYYRRWKKHETDLPFPNGENGSDVWLRAKYVIDRIRENAESTSFEDRPYRACIVAHGGTIRSMICGLLGIPQKMRYQFAATITSCSVSIVRIAPDSSENVNTDSLVTLELFNDIHHLE